jgi:L-fuculose-phosphate aldolase
LNIYRQYYSSQLGPNQTLIDQIIREALRQCLSDIYPAGRPEASTLFHSAEAEAIKREIVDVGKKLWTREYVDGNGGNISFRISQDYILCTPTMCSKADLTSAHISLVDLDNNRVLGEHAHTSEILLHLEIYKAVPQARAVIHCHPPHATAYAITGLVPPGEITPEQEIFVGPVATAPYDTPGTKSFAETVLPFVRYHNAILLENHGVVCWADTVTHAEWCVEVLDTYCRTIILASQLGRPIRQIPPDRIPELLAIKQKLGLPDARLRALEPDYPRSSLYTEGPSHTLSAENHSSRKRDDEFESLVANVTNQVMRFASQRKE